MHLQYTFEEIIKLTIKQMQNNFFDLNEVDKEIIKLAGKIALDRCEVSFSMCLNKYYHKDGVTYFDPLHSGQYAIYLYYLSNTLYKEFKSERLASTVYYLNKVMHSIDIYFEVELPNVFYFEHPVGTVLGRAKYSDKLVAYQNCTVGGNKGKYPTIGENVSLLSYSCILGDSTIGDNCIISSHTYIKDEDIPSNSIVFGSSPNLIIKPNNKNIILGIFKY